MKKVFSGKKLFYVVFSISIFILILPIHCTRGKMSSGQLEKITVLQSSVSPGDPHILSFPVSGLGTEKGDLEGFAEP